MMECEVVYWPRHLWTSATVTTAAAASSSTALCRRYLLALCSKPPPGLELLPAKSPKTRCVVLFDAPVAALGDFETLHSPQLLQQIGEQFACSHKGGMTAAAASGGGTTGLLETVGYYALFVPFAALLAVATAFQHFVQDMQTPSWLFVVGGKSLVELSTFLAVLSQQLHNAASLPERLRHFYLLNKQRRLSHQERSLSAASVANRLTVHLLTELELLQVFNWICFVLLDMILGQLALTYVDGITASDFQATNISPIRVVESLRGNVEWLMGAPAGFKLNKPLASILGNGILLWLNLWSFVFEELSVIASNMSLGWRLLVVGRYMGVTLQLTLMADFVKLTTWHSHWVYLYFAKLNRLQFGLFSSLSKLFLGKKINVLRHRVDTCEYDVGQLLLGTLLFTILSFLGCVAACTAIVVAVAARRGAELVALASLLYRVWNPRFFIVGVELQTCQDPEDTGTVIENIGVGCQPAQLDVQLRRTLRQALASWENSNESNAKSAVFELVPVASSFSAQFTRLRAYLQAVGARYSLAIIVKACLFGSAGIARVPLSILFGLSYSG
ncbi:N-acetylglucosaminyl transferase component [Phytophthora cactorum]|nr:N-acetylglucosaminyl transferase component [Phytophthora cactorum]